ncbi:LacI family DNA-binding transcriptional regulator [Maricaulis sp. D1M11]|uniref:LacI family DNA-binding transcriptional regulator n=1 Tax=Maricaulis sp. D1M11 TaxID=3076117 RepID=UPI0039B451B4
MARMIDVAKKAGVSLKTVSRVLNNEPHVKDVLRERVKTAAEEVGYVPSASARRLRSNRSYNLQLLSHSDRSNYVNAIQFGAIDVCQTSGYQLVIALLEGVSKRTWSELHDELSRILNQAKPDGLILVPPLSNDERVAGILSEFDIPVARIGPTHGIESPITIAIDEQAAAQQLTDLLIAAGHEKIAFLRGKEDQAATHLRFRGYRDALDAAGLTFNPEWVLPGNFEFPSGLAAGEALLAMEDRPTAVFAANDDMAAGVIMAGHRAGLDLPAELSVVGFDDSEIADKTWPAITTVHQPLVEYGRLAARLLIEKLGGIPVIGASVDAPELSPGMISYSLVERDSISDKSIKTKQ